MKPHEDWVDGSWTVDCVCSVDFDDGKEMVNCDECGVWVHTWCSRYVKGDDLFACHKCKIKSNDIEVSAAKLLVTKALRMESLSSQSHTVPMNSGFRACTEIPIEERVHVQGVPGGDLALFQRFSSVFSRQLWECTGYVPKKFRFQYREFPCWDDKENVCGIVHREDACAGVLLSMSKGNDVAAHAKNEMERSQSDSVKKEKRLICALSTDKVRREDCGDRVKKKVRVAEEEKEDDDDKNDLLGKTLLCPYNAIGERL